VAEVRERLAVNKQKLCRFHMERFNLRKLNEVESKEKYCVDVSKKFAASEKCVHLGNDRSKSHGSMEDPQNYYIKGNKLNCSGYMIQVKLMGII
jgi:hypothetical protein